MSAAVKDALRSFLRVWVVGTVMLFLPGLFGWINGVTDWAKAEGSTPFPDARGLLFLFVAAITSAFVAAGAGLLRLFENLSGKTLLPRPAGPASVPQPPPGERGAAAPGLLTILGVVLLVLLLIALLR